MNITRRLSKIEEKINPSNGSSAKFCGCFLKHMLSVCDEVYNDDPDVKIDVPPYPDFTKSICDICSKPFSKDDIESDKDLTLMYGDSPGEES